MRCFICQTDDPCPHSPASTDMHSLEVTNRPRVRQRPVPPPREPTSPMLPPTKKRSHLDDMPDRNQVGEIAGAVSHILRSIEDAPPDVREGAARALSRRMHTGMGASEQHVFLSVIDLLRA